MISFTTDGVAFQVRAAVVVVHGGRVLLHRAEGDDFWTLPGGRVEPGEDAKAAVTRELSEELGEDLTCNRLLYIVENFFDHEGVQHHEIAFYFLASLPPDSGLGSRTDYFSGIEPEKQLEFAWFGPTAIRTLKLYPEFLRQGIAELDDGIMHVVERGNECTRFR